MLRYVPHLRERCAEVLLECPPALMELIRSVPGIAEIFPYDGAPRERFDTFVRAMTLPRLCGEDGTPGRSGVPYLSADPARVQHWAPRLAAPSGVRRVGLAWAGNPQHENDRRRSIPLGTFAPLAGVPNVRYVSLQVGARAGDVAPPDLRLLRPAAEIAGMADTAAIVTQLDLVISADTGVAHLAGALGVPVWLILPWRPDWRWSPASDATPWYPTMRLFHAAGPAFDAVLAQVAQALRGTC
jgi:hypothetical protein